jgi:hypothetical protein
MIIRGLFSAELVLGLRWIELVTALFMTGLIWFVQVVHYPLLARVGAGSTAYQNAHMKRTTGLVAVPMLAELASGVVLAALRIGPAWQRWPATVLLAAVWLATFTLLVPAHDSLTRAFDARVHRRLVAANWLRTVAWTVRSALCIAALGRCA